MMSETHDGARRATDELSASMPDWRKAAGVLRGAIPPGETPESMIRRMRDGESDADRAVAVLDRLFTGYAHGTICLQRAPDGSFTAWVDVHDAFSLPGVGDTPAAALLALLALGARLEAAASPENDGRGRG